MTNWRKASARTGTATCTEVHMLPDGGAQVRDGKNPDGPVLTFDAAEWAAFLEGVRNGEFDNDPQAQP